jgi:hypothetical protein
MSPSLLVLPTSSKRATWPWTQMKRGAQAKGGSGPPRPHDTPTKSLRQSSSSSSSGGDTQTTTGSQRQGGLTVKMKIGLLLGPLLLLLLLPLLLLRGSVRRLCLLPSWQRVIWRWCRLLKTSGCWSSCGNRCVGRGVAVGCLLRVLCACANRGGGEWCFIGLVEKAASGGATGVWLVLLVRVFCDVVSEGRWGGLLCLLGKDCFRRVWRV